MKLKDLKSGMLVQYRNGSIRMIINGYAVGALQFTELDSLDPNTLLRKNATSKQFDIMKVTAPLTGQKLIPRGWNPELVGANLLWERSAAEDTRETAFAVRYTINDRVVKGCSLKLNRIELDDFNKKFDKLATKYDKKSEKRRAAEALSK